MEYVFYGLGALIVAWVIYKVMTKAWPEENESKAVAQNKLLKLVCQKGQRDFWINGFIPHIPAVWKRKIIISYEVTLGEDAKYILPGADQKDWNKGGGKSYNFIDHLIDTIMWGWRWTPELDRFELCSYAHVDGQKVISPISEGTRYDDKEVALRVKSGKRFFINITTDFTGKIYNVSFSDGLVTNGTKTPFTHDLSWEKEITANFGGNQKAPKKLIVGWFRK